MVIVSILMSSICIPIFILFFGGSFFGAKGEDNIIGWFWFSMTDGMIVAYLFGIVLPFAIFVKNDRRNKKIISAN